jgi:hypothetical protein
VNQKAKIYFANNPDEPYWYYNDHIRIPNPRFSRDPKYQPAPWPPWATVKRHKESAQ